MNWIALLGRRDIPVDGVEDYCSFLGQALGRHGTALELVRVPWAELGWWRALRELRRKSTSWRGNWVLLQYTALGWSRRGFSFCAVAALRVLRGNGVHCAIVFHDSNPFTGSRSVDQLRRACQTWVMRSLSRKAERIVFTIPPEKISWLNANTSWAVLIPVGANLPEDISPAQAERLSLHDRRTVAVYGVSDSVGLQQEIPDIIRVMRRAAADVPRLRLLVLGRAPAETKAVLEKALDGTGVELSVLGLLPAEGVRKALVSADVLLFVRGPVSSRRGSAMAGIACGLPVVAYESSETLPPITEAGLLLAPLWDRDKLAEELIAILNNEELWRELSAKSRDAWRTYFSWDVIAQHFLRALAPEDPSRQDHG